MTIAFDPLAPGGSPGSRGPVPASAGEAWTREFQAAGRLAWFHAPNDRRGADALPLRRFEAAPAQAAAGAPPPPRSSFHAASALGFVPPTDAQLRPALGATSSSVPRSGLPRLPPSAVCTFLLAAPAMHGAATNPPLHLEALPALGPARPPCRSADTSHAQAAARVVAVAPAFVKRDPLRVHVEETPHGVRVWLGVDAAADPRALRTADIGDELRRLLAASGHRLDALFCNGRSVVARPMDEPKER